jgi:hypothetical protein
MHVEAEPSIARILECSSIAIIWPLRISSSGPRNAGARQLSVTAILTRRGLTSGRF